ncbi:uncharacterized protein LOC122368041 [Amphibalanus amphitrite]|uniref:uncharacterized protein LOC122368041 n=1 Tax=Amphibalanus amphitrite TaxID=1232801 RepID=UPI001C91C56D|nr:uncharacterized protein LOC122368041 [Amphibalanus amphitrite]XP_043197573.1 uncharacterized protein LOC122368041 [Amphibalanus amphitrite]
MGEEEELDAVITKLEMELQQLREQLKNNHASSSGGAAASSDPQHQEEQEEGAAEEDPVSAFLDWSQQQAVLDAELEEQLRARIATAEQVNAELEQHADTLQRVTAARRRVGSDTAALRQRIKDRHHEQRRLFTALRRELNHVLRSIYSQDGFLSIARLMDVLLTQFQDAPHDPYVPVTDDMLPEHLSMLERGGIVRFEGRTEEQRVRLVDHAVNLRSERIVPQAEGNEEIAAEEPQSTSSSGE